MSILYDGFADRLDYDFDYWGEDLPEFYEEDIVEITEPPYDEENDDE